VPDSSSLGAALRAARVSAGLTGTELADLLGWSQSAVSRVERGLKAISPEEIAAWCAALGLSADQAAQIASEAVSMHLAPLEHSQQDGMAERQRDMGALRASMTAFGEVALAAVPGLLQTPAYALRMLRSLGERSGQGTAGAESAVAARMNNQALLYDSARQFEFIIASSALRYPAGPHDIMHAQAEKIIGLMDLPNVNVMTLAPDAAPDIPLLSGWAFYDIPSGPQVLVELLAAEVWISGQNADVYRTAFGILAQSAASGASAADIIRSVMIG
jgi:transcriptional regulator with XRE-family HTH domain